MRTTFIAAPLTARSGVYRSGRELVAEGRRQGHDWQLVLGVSAKAGGQQPADDPDWITEFTAEPRGVGGVRDLRKRLLALDAVSTSDMLVSLIPQTDMSLALSTRPWVAFLRGLPWPATGEANALKANVWKTLEKAALSRAREVWTTTEMLRTESGLHQSVIVPAGIAPVPRVWDGAGTRRRAVWAARYNHDKNPDLFFDALRGQEFEGVLHGSGPLESELRSSAPANVEVGGWARPDQLWQDAFAYVGTSHREAFGRSALEAAMSGIPVIMSEAFGVAPFLVTDPELREMFVLPVDQPAQWRTALAALHTNEALRKRYSHHLVVNAAELTIESSARAVAARLAELALRR